MRTKPRVPTPSAHSLPWSSAAARANPSPTYSASANSTDSNFGVTPAVLIPRPETELLVELALARMPANAAMRVLDLGTGSGAIAVVLAKQRPQARLTAVDLDYPALSVARANAKRHGVSVRFFCGDWFGALSGESFDLIVSNPPYVAAADPHLAAGDVRFEPQRALVGGADGLDCIRAIVAKAGAHLQAGAWLLFEHGYDQAEACRALLQAQGYRRGAILARSGRNSARERRFEISTGPIDRSASKPVECKPEQFTQVFAKEW